MGLARPLPAMSGAEPWTASKTAAFVPMFAPAAIPSPPMRPAQRSLTMSPKRLGSRSTSNCWGRETSCMQQLSTMMSLAWMSEYSRATSRKESKKSPSVIFMMLALWTQVTVFRLSLRAVSNANFAARIDPLRVMSRRHWARSVLCMCSMPP